MCLNLSDFVICLHKERKIENKINVLRGEDTCKHRFEQPEVVMSLPDSSSRSRHHKSQNYFFFRKKTLVFVFSIK